MSGRPISSTPGGVALRLRVQPRASRDEVAGVLGDEVRIRLTAPPVDGAANEALVRLLSARLSVPRSAVTIAAGHTGRHKLVRVAGLSVEEAASRLGVP